MKDLFVAEKNKRNSGFSLVELVVAIGILAVISTIVAFIMTSSSRNYSRMSVEAQLQSEAQLVANAISEYAIDSYDADNLCAESIDSVYDNTENKILVLHSLARDGVEYDYVIARTAENKLYLGERSKPVGGTWSAFSFSLLGNYIADFTVDVSHVEKENIIDFQLTYTKNNRSYNGNYQVLMRNRAYADKDPEVINNNEPLKLVLGLQPKQVYIDIVGGDPGNYYYINEISDGSRRSLASKEIDFTASVTSNKMLDNEDVEWFLNGADANGFKMPAAEAGADGNKTLSKTAKLQIVDGYSFKNSAIDDFTVSIAKSVTDSDGNTVSATSKQSKIHLRRVKSINIIPTSGYTSWKSSYDDIGEPSSEAKSYAVPNIYGVYQPMVLRANVIQKWVPYGGGLTWKILMRQKGASANAWVTPTSNYASLQYSETDNSTINSVSFGSNAKNGQLYKVIVTSKFDSSVTAEYIFGVAPRERELGGGFNSRGFYVSLEEFAEAYADDLVSRKMNYDSSPNSTVYKAQAVEDFKNGNITDVIVRPGGGGGGFENSAFKVELINGKYYLYLDYEAFKYGSIDKMRLFYDSWDTGITDPNAKRTCGRIELIVKTTGIAEDGQTVTGSFTVYYWIAPVLVHKISPDRGFMVIRRGQSQDVKIKTDYYNILSENYFGIYVKNSKNDTSFGTNLIGANSDLNPYLTCNVQNSYGDVKHFVDTMRVTIKAKDSLVYNPNPMVVRFTAEEYYKLCDEDLKIQRGPIYDEQYGYKFYTSPCTDMTVYVANVSNQDVFIPCPATTATYTDGTSEKSLYPLSKVTGSDKVDIKVYKADGTVGIAKTYKSGTQYKCDYAGSTYTYNPTYYYWYN